jgi:hypothetical protein
LGSALEKTEQWEEAAEAYEASLEVLTPGNYFPLYRQATSSLSAVNEKVRASKASA